MPDIGASLHLISVMALPFLLAVTLHEAGHALAAYRLGDRTAQAAGRLSLNPLVHVDPFGTVAIPLIAIFTGFPFLIGYAKPVPVDPRNFKKTRRDIVLVALAGPFGNVVVAVFFAYVLRFALGAGFTQDDWVTNVAVFGIFLNCLFMVFNLLPIPPLDGGAVVAQFLPSDLAIRYQSIAPFGFLILMGIIIVARDVIIAPTMFFAGLIAALVGVPL
ncbi:site-2 protease family protein [Eilatimonas milleporae]|uniref:Zn-dependent protease n=1 Tax=Eilatimonas milleporae TaxID=911205 RepID=A0A3M0C5B3_9PROT|nr:site-2 protease family protein [Eilatimonas milleporae]RMB05014.1 Zn-dependent protease [Eilatimonas milleporae]